MTATIKFSGPAKYRLQSIAMICRATLDVSARRLLRGPRRPSWNYAVELGTEILKRQMQNASRMKDVSEARRYVDSVFLKSTAVSEVDISRCADDAVEGVWFRPLATEPKITVLYLHGGGYSLYPEAFYKNLIAMFTLAARSRTFALDYRLTPEYPFPAQLDDALDAYRWLLASGVDPAELVVAGDSAGGNLTLALLLAARDLNLPLPALAIALSPATDFEADLTSGLQNAEFDWIDQRMLVNWGGWFCLDAERRNPLVSPICADLRGLPPIYIQDGGSEILHNSIQAFAERAKQQGADVVLESWADMNHDFQFFGREAPQSIDALRRIAEVVATRLPSRTKDSLQGAGIKRAR